MIFSEIAIFYKSTFLKGDCRFFSADIDCWNNDSAPKFTPKKELRAL